MNFTGSDIFASKLDGMKLTAVESTGALQYKRKMESLLSSRSSSFMRDPTDGDEEDNVQQGSGDHHNNCTYKSQHRLSSGDGSKDGYNDDSASSYIEESPVYYTRLDTVKSCQSGSGSRNDFSTGMSGNEELSPNDRETLYSWIGDIPLSKPVKHFQRDFSDGVLLAEIIAHFFPRLIELHSYVPANSVKLKRENWELLNRKALPKLGMKLKDSVIENICQAKVGFIERVLERVRQLIKRGLEDEAKAYLRGSGDDETESLVPETCFIHRSSLDDMDAPPDFIVFREKKYIHESLVNDKEQVISDLSDKNKELTSKVRRLDTLLQLKENSLQDLTQELYQLKLNYNKIIRGEQDDGGRLLGGTNNKSNRF